MQYRIEIIYDDQTGVCQVSAPGNGIIVKGMLIEAIKAVDRMQEDESRTESETAITSQAPSQSPWQFGPFISPNRIEIIYAPVPPKKS